MEKYRRECLKSYSANRSGEVVKKLDFPTLQPLTDAQRDNKMIDMVHQAVGQAFINSAPVMTKTVHNAVLKTVGATQGYLGPCYMQPNQMGFAPMGQLQQLLHRLQPADQKRTMVRCLCKLPV